MDVVIVPTPESMYTTCLFCHRDLGANEAIERFPVGRRIAFDPARGRLWAVCRRCERWNLSPLDTRWEAIEECERRFRDTRVRVSTDEIGLARLAEGLELVRIGEPLRPEFAAWRYGDQFGRRRKRAIAYTAAGVAAGGAVVAGGAVAGVSIGGTWWLFAHLFQHLRHERTVDRLWTPDGDPIRIQFKHLNSSRLVPGGDDGGWTLHVDHSPGWGRGSGGRTETLLVTGPEAVDLAARLMAKVNRAGGKERTVRDAVARIETAGHPEAYLRTAAREAERRRREKAGGQSWERLRAKKRRQALPGSLRDLPADARLAVEMATQEEAEREAMTGELKGLEAAWRRAEEIARIADDLFVPEEVRGFIERERRALEGADGRG